MIIKPHSQMNNNRLSTNNPNINSLYRTQLHNDVNNLLAQSLVGTPHKRTVKLVSLLDEKGELIQSFPSVYSCAKYLNVNKYRINKNLNGYVEVHGNIYFIRSLSTPPGWIRRG